ncbi:MAG: c-type cytochrome [Saprospiraceae bacterium]|nr:c-type cytochrome [Saprospiraceae bacterium]
MKKTLKNPLLLVVFIAAAFTLSNCDSDTNVYKHGKILYDRYCANCHMEDGSGLKGLIPPLAKSDYLLAHRAELPCILLRGQQGKIVVNGVEYGNQEMPPIKRLTNDPLTDFEIANILNYVSTSMQNNEKIWTIDEVRAGLSTCP